MNPTRKKYRYYPPAERRLRGWKSVPALRTLGTPLALRHAHKLDRCAVEQIRAAHAAGASPRKLAARYGVTTSAVRYWLTKANYLPRDWVTLAPPVTA